VSVTDEGKLITSFKPFAASGHQDAADRLKTLGLPVDLAIEMSTAPNSASRVLQPISESSTEMRFAWNRTEKQKRHQWMITCGLNAASLVYAYTGMALHHEDQPAKEMAAISGLPSSDGVPLPEAAIVDARLERLDKAWEKVVSPILGPYLAVRGVDQLKLHGWNILIAITSEKSSSDWSLDRLLCSLYLSGEALGDDKERGMTQLLGDIEAEAIEPSDVPAWGENWVVKRLDPLLAMFNAALVGVHGIHDITNFKWIKNSQGDLVLPVGLSQVWCNFLRALSTAKGPDSQHPGEAFITGLRLITRQLVQIFNLEPATYLPISLMSADGSSVQDLDTTRINLFDHLYGYVRTHLGTDVLSTVRLTLGSGEAWNAMDQVVTQSAFGARADSSTVGCSILGVLLRTKALSFPLQPNARTAFKALLSKTLQSALSPASTSKLLGDMTNRLPWIFEEYEELQLDVWRLLGKLPLDC
jgi:hypothetical protein